MNDLKKNHIIKYLPVIPFLIFFILMVKQYLNVFVYFDDYGFASLSYSNSIEGVNGLDFNLKQLLKFLYMYYMDWGGRVISFGTEALLLKNGVIVMQLFMAIAVTSIMFFTYKIIQLYPSKNKWFTAIGICSLYGLLHIGMLRDSFYWYTSAVIYVMPFLPYLIGVFWYASNVIKEIEETKEENNVVSIVKNILLMLIIFVASFTQEQVSISLSFVVCEIVFYKFLSIRKIHVWDYIYMGASILGTIFVVFAPGNSKRMDEQLAFYNTPLVTRTIANVNAILKEVFGYKFIYVMTVYIMALLFMSILMIRKEYKGKVINFIFSLINSLVLIIYLVKKEPLYAFLSDKINDNLLLIILFLYIIFMMVQITRYFYGEKKYVLLIMFWASMCTISSMAFIPTITIRCYVPFVILSFGIITSLLSDFIDEIKYGFVIGIVLLLIILPFSFKNYNIIRNGYEANYVYHVQNDNILKETSSKIKMGEQIKEVHLQKLNDTICSNVMPYEEGFAFVQIWMCEYYDIPKEIEFIWEDR